MHKPTEDQIVGALIGILCRPNGQPLVRRLQDATGMDRTDARAWLRKLSKNPRRLNQIKGLIKYRMSR